MPTSAAGCPERAIAGRARAPRRAAGFTLIEVLVSVVILAVVASAVVLALPDTGERRLQRAADQAATLLAMACERAEASGRDVGIAVDRGGLAFGPFHERGGDAERLAAEAAGVQIDDAPDAAAGRWSWRALPDDPAEALRPRRFPPGVSATLEVDGQPLALGEARPSTPQLACLAGGEYTPFVLVLALEGAGEQRLRGRADGALVRGDAP